MRRTLLAVAALCLSSLAARADTVYNYVGQDFQYADGPYTTMDKVTGSFTVANPIAANYSGLVYTNSFSFNDGVQTITNANGHFVAFDITTDANGDISYYEIVVTEADPEWLIRVTKQNNVGDVGLDVADSNGGGASVYLFGEFTEQPAPPTSATPEPSSFALLGTGLLGVAGVVRKRFA